MTGKVPIPAPETCPLADGTDAMVRPLGPDDAPLLAELFAVLSPQSIYNRFLTPLTRISAAQLDRATRVDARVECALAACLRDGDRWRIAGVGRFRCSGPDRAELAIVVGDPWQRRGLARLLLRRLTDTARAMGLAWFDSTIDPCNMKLLRFAEAVGFKGELKYRDGLLHMRTDIAALFPGDATDPIDRHERP